MSLLSMTLHYAIRPYGHTMNAAHASMLATILPATSSVDDAEMMLLCVSYRCWHGAADDAQPGALTLITSPISTARARDFRPGSACAQSGSAEHFVAQPFRALSDDVIYEMPRLSDAARNAPRFASAIIPRAEPCLAPPVSIIGQSRIPKYIARRHRLSMA